jgi:hypothetical protein
LGPYLWLERPDFVDKEDVDACEKDIRCELECESCKKHLYVIKTKGEGVSVKEMNKFAEDIDSK